MTFAELQFLKAEAIIRGMITGNAADEYAKGIRASMQKWAAISSDDVDVYLARPDVALNTAQNEALNPELKVGTSVSSAIPVRYIYSDNEQNNPNLISWTNEKIGRMVNETDIVWFQPQKWNTNVNR